MKADKPVTIVVLETHSQIISLIQEAVDDTQTLIIKNSFTPDLIESINALSAAFFFFNPALLPKQYKTCFAQLNSSIRPIALIHQPNPEFLGMCMELKIDDLLLMPFELNAVKNILFNPTTLKTQFAFISAFPQAGKTVLLHNLATEIMNRDLVLIEVPSQQKPISTDILNQSKQLFILTNNHKNELEQTRSLWNSLTKELDSASKLKLIINQTVPEPGLSKQETESFMQTKISHFLPYDPAFSTYSTEKSPPFIEAYPHVYLSQKIKLLAQQLL